MKMNRNIHQKATNRQRKVTQVTQNFLHKHQKRVKNDLDEVDHSEAEAEVEHVDVGVAEVDFLSRNETMLKTMDLP